VSTIARKETNRRLYLLSAILIFWGAAICVRLVYLQVFRYGDFEQRAQRQQQRTTDVAAKRGIIYDRAGRELAMSVSVESAFAVPTEIPDMAQTISLISRITRADSRELLAKCKAARTFCWVARKADAESAGRIRALNLRGIYFQKE
jgi:cell division protein FtsI (penicillin-binding protein 3)